MSIRGRKVTSIGVLYDFTGNDHNTTVQTVADMVKEQWFAEAIEDEPDFFLLVGSVSCSLLVESYANCLLRSDICLYKETTVITSSLLNVSMVSLTLCDFKGQLFLTPFVLFIRRLQSSFLVVIHTSVIAVRNDLYMSMIATSYCLPPEQCNLMDALCHWRAVVTWKPSAG